MGNVATGMERMRNMSVMWDVKIVGDTGNNSRCLRVVQSSESAANNRERWTRTTSDISPASRNNAYIYIP